MQIGTLDRNMRWRGIAANSALCLASFLFSLGLVEVALRLFHIVPNDLHRVVFPSPAPLFQKLDGIPDHLYTPGDSQQIFFACQGSKCRPDKWIDVYVNSAGLRDVEHSAIKPPGTVRILVLGDSFTSAVGVATPETYAKSLESLLNGRFTSRPRYETINAGIDGYSTYEEVAFLKRFGLRYQPDIIVLGFYLNDAYPAWDKRWSADPRKIAMYGKFQKRMAALNPDRILSNIPATTLHFSGFLHALRWLKAFRTQIHIPKNSKEWYRFIWSDENPVGMEQIHSAFGELARIQRERRIPVLVLIFPKLDWLDSGYPLADLHERVHELCRRYGLEFVDLLPLLTGRKPSTLWHHPSDHHPSIWVHKLAASVVFQRLLAGSSYRRALRLAP